MKGHGRDTVTFKLQKVHSGSAWRTQGGREAGGAEAWLTRAGPWRTPGGREAGGAEAWLTRAGRWPSWGSGRGQGWKGRPGWREPQGLELAGLRGPLEAVGSPVGESPRPGSH